MEKLNITVIGAGVVGLAVASELSRDCEDIFVLEKNPSFGQETSSRNSEVIHAGIYYPHGSLKQKACIEGRDMLYDFCMKHNVAHKKTGKLIVGLNRGESEGLKKLFRHGLSCGLKELTLISKQEIKKIEPRVEAESAIYSPYTGILDSHGLMKSLILEFESRSGRIAYNTEVKHIDKIKDAFTVTVEDNTGEAFKFSTNVLINSAGLFCDKISALAGLIKEEYKLKYCKGDYLRVPQGKAKFINRLVYPVPKEGRAGLGIHATPDLGGGLRLGPDDEYVEKIDYNIDPSKKKIFYESVRQFLPFIELEGLTPDTAGIRPKLQGPQEGFRDFIIKEESGNGFPGLVNLIGIESPGLTGSLSIAQMVRGLYKKGTRR